MKNTKIISLAAAISMALPALANEQISGNVTDANGKPISQAEVNLHGSRLTVKTDKNGYFSIVSNVKHHGELHIEADGFNHQLVTLDSNKSNYAIALTTSIIDTIDIYATPLHGSTLESAMPISVLGGEELNNKHAATLGDTLKNELGVHSSYYGPVASSPIIRGLDGPRVLVTQNGLDAGDVSRVGPDHVVATETATVKQIEILRGPATLFYGSGAIGGVVNVVDNRVPSEIEHSGEIILAHNTVADENEAAIDFNTGVGNFALHFDAFWRDSEDYEVPANPEMHDEHEHEGEGHGDEHGDEHGHEEEHHEEEFNGTIANSAIKADGFTLGGSYILDNGYVGVSFGQMNREYGIPGHDHGHHGHGSEGEGEHHDEEEGVFADMQQDRVQLLSELSFENSVITGLNTKIAFTDYEHSEIEGGEAGTTFATENTELRADILLHELFNWHGALSFNYKHSDFDVSGSEAFSPGAETTSTSVGLLAERHFGNVLVQLGARVESVDIDPTNTMEVPSHLVGEHDGHGDDHGPEAETTSITFNKQDFTPISLSAGLVWDFTKGYNLGLSYTHAERAPSSAELFSFGPHIGTGTYEIGAMFELHQESDESHFDLRSGDPDVETSNNLELSLRKFEGDFGFVVNVFYNQVDNYYFQEDTGIEIAFSHDHGDDHGGEHGDDHGGDHGDDLGDDHGDDHGDEHGDEEGLPAFLFQAHDAKFYGIESQFVWRTSEQLKLTVQADVIKGELDNGGNLPRIPPARLGLTTDYQLDSTDFSLTVMHHFEQSDFGVMESKTDAYTMVDFVANHYFDVNNIDMTAYFKINNLLDEEARVHSSFLKDRTLLPGRGFTFGLRGNF